MADFLTFDEIKKMLREKSEDEVIRDVGTRKVAPGLTVADYFSVLEFYRKASRLSAAKRSAVGGAPAVARAH